MPPNAVDLDPTSTAMPKSISKIASRAFACDAVRGIRLVRTLSPSAREIPYGRLWLLLSPGDLLRDRCPHVE
jgi:hypothetical protein